MQLNQTEQALAMEIGSILSSAIRESRDHGLKASFIKVNGSGGDIELTGPLTLQGNEISSGSAPVRAWMVAAGLLDAIRKERKIASLVNGANAQALARKAQHHAAMDLGYCVPARS